MKIDELLTGAVGPPADGALGAIDGEDGVSFYAVLDRVEEGVAMPGITETTSPVESNNAPALDDPAAEALLCCLLFSDGNLPPGELPATVPQIVVAGDAGPGAPQTTAYPDTTVPGSDASFVPAEGAGDAVLESVLLEPAEGAPAAETETPGEYEGPSMVLEAEAGEEAGDAESTRSRQHQTAVRLPELAAAQADDVTFAECSPDGHEAGGETESGDRPGGDQLPAASSAVEKGLHDTDAVRAVRELDLQTDAGNRLGEVVNGQIARGGGRMRVTLNPPELGEMQVEVLVRGERVGVRFDVDSPAAQAVLVREMPGLRELLESRGFTIDRADVYLGGGQGEPTNEQSSWGAGGGSEGETARDGAEAEDGEADERVRALDIEV